MVKHIKSIHAELRLHAFGDGEILHDRRVGIERSWSAVAEDTDIPQITRPGVGKWTARVRGDVGHRGEERHFVRLRIEGPRAGVERASTLARAANSHVFF